MSRGRPHLRVVPTTAPEVERNIRSDYYFNSNLIKTNRGRWPLNAAKTVFGNLRSNKYEATHAEVYNEATGKLYAVLRRTMEGNVKPLFQKPFKASEMPPKREKVVK